MIALVAALDPNNCIGKNNKLPWYLPADLQRFKQITLGSNVLMGRKTWDSLPQQYQPLPSRKNIVISYNSQLDLPQEVELFNDLKSAITSHPDGNLFIIGGSKIFEQSINLADTLYITHVNRKTVGCDVWFPEIDKDIWHEVEREDHDGFSFVIYKRVRSS